MNNLKSQQRSNVPLRGMYTNLADKRSVSNLTDTKMLLESNAVAYQNLNVGQKFPTPSNNIFKEISSGQYPVPQSKLNREGKPRSLVNILGLQTQPTSVLSNALS